MTTEPTDDPRPEMNASDTAEGAPQASPVAAAPVVAPADAAHVDAILSAPLPGATAAPTLFDMDAPPQVAHADAGAAGSDAAPGSARDAESAQESSDTPDVPETPAGGLSPEDAALGEVLPAAAGPVKLAPLSCITLPDVEGLTADVLVAAVESMALAASEPLSTKRFCAVLEAEGVELSDADAALLFAHAVERWTDPERAVGRGIALVSVAGGVAFRTVGATGHWVRRLVAEKPHRLTRAQLEVLAIASYRQPVTRPQIDDVRGVDSSGPLKKLLDVGLLKVLGKSEEIGRALLYGTTKRFLEFFELSSLRDLPTLREYQELDAHSHDTLRDQLGEETAQATIVELFEEASAHPLVSEATEAASASALEALSSALGKAKAIDKAAAAAMQTQGMQAESPAEASPADAAPSDPAAPAAGGPAATDAHAPDAPDAPA